MASKNNNIITMTIMLAILFAAALVVPAVNAQAGGGDCFCPCMKNKCMVLDHVTREECASACDQTCTSLAYVGQPNKHEFCGF